MHPVKILGGPGPELERGPPAVHGDHAGEDQDDAGQAPGGFHSGGSRGAVQGGLAPGVLLAREVRIKATPRASTPIPSKNGMVGREAGLA